MRKAFLLTMILVAGNFCTAQNFSLEDWDFTKDNKYTTYKIYFMYDKAELHDSSSFELNRIRDFLIKNEKLVVEVGVHLDQQSTELYGQDLSQKRAQTIVNYLIKNGIAKERLLPKGYGDSQPLEQYDEGRSKNRRVVIKIL